MAQKKYADVRNTNLPLAYRWLLANKLFNFYPWYLIRERSEADAISQAFAQQFTDTSAEFDGMYPIARRDDGFEVAGFQVAGGEVLEKVVVCEIHWQVGQQRQSRSMKMHNYQTLWDWLSRSVLKDTRQWVSEEALSDLTQLEL